MQPRSDYYYDKEWDGDPGVGERPVPGSTTGETETVLRLMFSDGGTLPRPGDGDTLCLKVEDEILQGAWSAADDALVDLKRGLFGTAAVEHSADSEWREVARIVSPDATGVPERRGAKFTAGDTPEDVLLQLLTSGHPTASTYNTVGAWGAKYDASRIDVESFERIRDTVHASEHVCGYADEEVGARTFLTEHILKPFGLYLVDGADDRIRLGYLRNAPADSVATIDDSVVVGQPEWASGSDRVVGTYRLESDLRDDEAGSIYVDNFIDTQRRRGRAARTLVHRSVLVHARDGIADPLGSYRQAQRVFDSRRAYLLARYGKPPPILKVTVLFSVFAVGSGDVVDVDLPGLPSVTGSGRGYLGKAEVLSKSPRDADGVIDFDLLLLGGMLDRYGLVSPSARITGIAGTVLTVEANTYTAEPDTDAGKFAVGDLVLLVSPKFDATVWTSLSAVGANTITVGAVGAAATGWFVTYGDWSPALSIAQRGSGYAAFADANEQVGPEPYNSRAFRYSGI
jgi:hypothetical protein